MVQPIKQPRGARPTEQRLRQTLMATTLLASLAGTFHATAHAAPATAPNASVSTRQVNVAVPAQDLDQALTQFADQADLHLLFTSAEVAGLHSPALDGQMSIEQALQTLLAGSGLNWQFSDARTVIVRKPDTAAKGLQLKALEVSVGARTSTAISEIPGTVWVVDQVQLQEQLDTGVTSKKPLASWCRAWIWPRRPQQLRPEHARAQRFGDDRRREPKQLTRPVAAVRQHLAV